MWIRWLSLCNFDIIFLVAQNCIRELTFRGKYALCFNGVTGTCFLSSSHSSVKHIKFICFFAELKFKKLCKMDFEALARQSLMALLQYVVVYSIRLNKVQLHIKKNILLIQLYKKEVFVDAYILPQKLLVYFAFVGKAQKVALVGSKIFSHGIIVIVTQIA